MSKEDKTLAGFSFMYTLIAKLTKTHAPINVGSTDTKYPPQRPCISTATALHKTNIIRQYMLIHVGCMELCHTNHEIEALGNVASSKYC